MTAETSRRRRILVPIDLHGINRGTLETLVCIARQLDAGVVGLLLEDVRLQQVADLPFTTEITLSGGRERSLLRDHLSQRHSLVTTDTSRLLLELAERDRVELTFENAAGHRLHTALDRDGHLDIFFPARQRWQLVAASYQDTAAIRRLGVMLADTAQDTHVVQAAKSLLQAGLVGELYVLSNHSPQQEQLDALYRPDKRVCVHANVSCDPPALTALIRQSAYDLLLLPRDCLSGIAPETLDAALEKSSGQVLVIN